MYTKENISIAFFTVFQIQSKMLLDSTFRDSTV